MSATKPQVLMNPEVTMPEAPKSQGSVLLVTVVTADGTEKQVGFLLERLTEVSYEFRRDPVHPEVPDQRLILVISIKAGELKKPYEYGFGKVSPTTEPAAELCQPIEALLKGCRELIEPINGSDLLKADHATALAIA